jgi:hypothetical protein
MPNGIRMRKTRRGTIFTASSSMSGLFSSGFLKTYLSRTSFILFFGGSRYTPNFAASPEYLNIFAPGRFTTLSSRIEVSILLISAKTAHKLV